MIDERFWPPGRSVGTTTIPSVSDAKSTLIDLLAAVLKRTCTIGANPAANFQGGAGADYNKNSNITQSRGRMNRFVHRTIVTPSCHLSERISPGGWAVAIGLGLGLWTMLFALM